MGSGRDGTDAQLLRCGAEPGGGPDLIVGGFPCQDLSVAGKRAGLAGERSGLFFEFVRIGRETKAPWALLENVPGLLSSNAGRDFRVVLESLADVWPAVGWRVLDSRFFGVAQRRRRVFIVCGPSREAVAAVLFEREGGGGDTAEVEEARARIAAGTLSRALCGVGGGNDQGANKGATLVTHPLQDADLDRAGAFVVAKPLGSSDGGQHLEREYVTVTATLTPGAHPDGHNGQDDTKDGHLIPAVAGVRRLMPVECERLQAFPDGWTCLQDHEQPCNCPDGPRYRALGNAVTVSVAEWIGRRLRAVEEIVVRERK